MLFVTLLALGLCVWIFRDWQHSAFARIPAEGALSAATLCVVLATSEQRPCLLSVGCGMVMATLQRYVIHRLFHALPWWNKRHERNHNHVRRRGLDGAPNVTSLCESAASATTGMLLPITHAVWIGMLLEHVIEERVRTHVILGKSGRYGRWPPAVRRFWSNLETTFWVHVMVESGNNLCFACPFWDRLFGTHFFATFKFIFEDQGGTWSFPFPLWDAAFGPDLQPWRVLVDRAFAAFKESPDLWRQSVPKLPL